MTKAYLEQKQTVLLLIEFTSKGEYQIFIICYFSYSIRRHMIITPLVNTQLIKKILLDILTLLVKF